MAAKIIDGKAIAETIRGEIRAEVEKLAASGVTPGVATILVGDDGGARFYRGQIEKNTGTVGFAYFDHTLPADATEAEVLALVESLDADPAVHGILALMPMPAHIDQTKVFNAIAPVKDLDCVNPADIGHVLLGDQLFAPATPSACIEILDREGVALQGLDVTIVNHSNIVGKPAALLCLNRNASVHVVHVYSKDVPAACREADVLISAAPVKGLIKGDMVKPGAVVIDVTTIRGEDGKQVGSLEWEAVCAVAGSATPVPGGVGPVTNVILLKNALAACKAQVGVA
ncbi:MAG TPA: tetrahydrofolate dehydrogenase/cyclohydrolase catalytic domain-containing protein [Thermoleophilia bacterium]|nr:tetrahydrofolate dehydrogenase/cyclohydrolase catalytic domain-containing protein [Thermoleophilia bacterium]HQG03742.1 tetrahydrofolate dehydrogenase/cyclohydrolase catalytic domain-containing protein [Thermoleophilia bacterium]HQJ98149.1 tetrahydrofolate dehydrogenase/cyclohydrolase catalytic domain-containing protein [Thermoleophilia bacterium]